MRGGRLQARLAASPSASLTLGALVRSFFMPSLTSEMLLRSESANLRDPPGLRVTLDDEPERRSCSSINCFWRASRCSSGGGDVGEVATAEVRGGVTDSSASAATLEPRREPLLARDMDDADGAFLTPPSSRCFNACRVFFHWYISSSDSIMRVNSVSALDTRRAFSHSGTLEEATPSVSVEHTKPTRGTLTPRCAQSWRWCTRS